MWHEKTKNLLLLSFDCFKADTNKILIIFFYKSCFIHSSLNKVEAKIITSITLYPFSPILLKKKHRVHECSKPQDKHAPRISAKQSNPPFPIPPAHPTTQSPSSILRKNKPPLLVFQLPKRKEKKKEKTNSPASIFAVGIMRYSWKNNSFEVAVRFRSDRGSVLPGGPQRAWKIHVSDDPHPSLCKTGSFITRSFFFFRCTVSEKKGATFWSRFRFDFARF